MTVEEFKKLKPEYKDVEGDELWDAMTYHMLKQQLADETLKQINPIWKTHTLRWLFYRRVPNLVMGNPKTDKWTSENRCSKCKCGVNYRMGFIFTDANGNRKYICKCPHCNDDYVAEPNTNLSHKIYLSYKYINNMFWGVLDKLHLVRSSINGRYDMGGDESRYVKRWVFTSDFSKQKKPELHKRKWWEYILIEKPFHNF